jgi:hypothetical protein
MLFEDICDGFLRFGLDHLLFICGHKGNMPILEQVGRRMRETHRLRVATIEPWSWLTPTFRREAYGNEKVSIGHGSDPMGSLAMALYPEDVRKDLLARAARLLACPSRRRAGSSRVPVFVSGLRRGDSRVMGDRVSSRNRREDPRPWARSAPTVRLRQMPLASPDRPRTIPMQAR